MLSALRCKLRSMPRENFQSKQLRRLTTHTPTPHQQTTYVEPEIKPYSAIPGPRSSLPVLGKWGNALEMGRNMKQWANYYAEILEKYGDIARIRLPG